MANMESSFGDVEHQAALGGQKSTTRRGVESERRSIQSTRRSGERCKLLPRAGAKSQGPRRKRFWCIFSLKVFSDVKMGVIFSNLNLSNYFFLLGAKVIGVSLTHNLAITVSPSDLLTPLLTLLFAGDRAEV